MVPSEEIEKGVALVRPSMSSVTVNCPVIGSAASSSPVPVILPAIVAASFVVLTVTFISWVSV